LVAIASDNAAQRSLIAASRLDNVLQRNLSGARHETSIAFH